MADCDLKESLKSFIEYLDGIDYEQGDTPSLIISWYRSGNNRRKMIKKNGSSFLTMHCTVTMRRPDIEQGHKEGFLFRQFTSKNDDLQMCISECKTKVVEYIGKTYKKNN